MNHIEGHIHAVILEAGQAGERIEYPALALIASGGHTHLFEMRGPSQYRLLGRTRDDAAGEAFDKVAKLLGFGYPGGPVIDQLSPFGNPANVRLPLSKMKGNAQDFSFSGLKTAVLRWVEHHDMAAEIAARRDLRRRVARPSAEQWREATPQLTLDLIASFQNTVIEELLKRVARSAEQIGARAILISGGVACNSGLRERARSMKVALSGLLPHARALHRQRRHDCRRGLRQAGARGVRRSGCGGQRQPDAGVSSAGAEGLFGNNRSAV